MQLITVFLIELIVALLIGHGLLWLSRPGSGNGGQKPGHANGFNGLNHRNGVLSRNARPDFRRIPKNDLDSVPLAENELGALAANQRVLNEKINLLYSRIESFERTARESPEKVSEIELKSKIAKLDNFKANTEVEMTALRELIDELAKKKGLQAAKKFESKLSKVDSDLKLMDKDLHRLAFGAKQQA